MGILSTGIATFVWFKIVDLEGPIFMSMVNYLIPVWALILGIYLLDESLNFAIIIGMAFILSGIWLIQRKKLNDISICTFFYLISSLFTASLIILINLTTNLIWLMSQGFDISVIMFFELLLKDISNGLLFLIIILITFFLAFLITSILRYFLQLSALYPIQLQDLLAFLLC